MLNQSRILIVDDNPTNIAILEELLEDEYQLATSSCGEEALTTALDFDPALVLLDVMMPGLDGYETCRRLRSHPALQDAKVIMVSAKAMLAERLQGYAAGADDYVTKPFDQEELLAKVRVYLRLKSVEEIDRLKSEMLQWLCYETRTPLRGILAPVEVLMAEDAMERDERQYYLEMVYHSTVRLQSLFEKVILLSELKAGKQPFKFALASLSDLVRTAVHTVAEEAAESTVWIEQEVLDTPHVLLDKASMETVVVTLLKYAIRLSPMDSRVMVSLREQDEQVCLTVADEGEGIEPELLPHIFDEFAQADVRLLTDGQGLSLAIARQIVLAHNGTIRVQSMKGEGTKFAIKLPLTSL